MSSENRAGIIAATVGIGSMLLLTGLRELLRPYPGFAINLLEWFASLAFLWASMAAVITFRALSRTDRVVIWLRRFHEDPKGRVPFHRILTNACRSLALPLTIQDSTVKFSPLRALSTWVFLSPFVITAMFVLPLLINWGVYEILYANVHREYAFIATDDRQGNFWFAAFVAEGLLFWLTWQFMKRRGFVVVPAKNAVERGARIIDRAQHGWSLFRGIVVMRVTDDGWQDLARHCLRTADAIIIDVTSLTENMMWELKTAFENRSPETIVLSTAGGMPKAIRIAIRDLVGPAAFDRCHVFEYPFEEATVRERARQAASHGETLREVFRSAFAAKGRTATTEDKPLPSNEELGDLTKHARLRVPAGRIWRTLRWIALYLTFASIPLSDSPDYAYRGRHITMALAILCAVSFVVPVLLEKGRAALAFWWPGVGIALSGYLTGLFFHKTLTLLKLTWFRVMNLGDVSYLSSIWIRSWLNPEHYWKTYFHDVFWVDWWGHGLALACAVLAWVVFRKELTSTR